ncbi:uncharacterized protein [Watersipora subatra]|uniref:uncharacterized protein isoform X1 n=1 Tax=Watersipora subatra TaxID=2589382 RepID=UPI00355BDDA8
MQFEDGRWRIREEQLHNSYSTTEDAPENLVISSEIKYKPCSVSPNICRVYRVDNLYGIRQFIQIPWWFTNARIHSVHPLDQGTLLYIMGRDVVKGEDMVIIWSTIRDRYGLPSIVTKEQLIRYMCDANWFIQYASAMYYTNFPGQGLQLYTVVPSDYIRDVRYDSAHLLYEVNEADYTGEWYLYDMETVPPPRAPHACSCTEFEAHVLASDSFMFEQQGQCSAAATPLLNKARNYGTLPKYSIVI